MVADLTIKRRHQVGHLRPRVPGHGTLDAARRSTVAGFEAKAEIDRRDFGVNFEGTLENGSLVVGNKVVIELAVEAHKA